MVSGMVFTVKGAASASIYSVSEVLAIPSSGADEEQTLPSSWRSELRLQLFALARGMLALACQFCDTFCVGAGLTTIFLPALRHTVARRTGAFRYCCHDFSFLAEHARLI